MVPSPHGGRPPDQFQLFVIEEEEELAELWYLEAEAEATATATAYAPENIETRNTNAYCTLNTAINNFVSTAQQINEIQRDLKCIKASFDKFERDLLNLPSQVASQVKSQLTTLFSEMIATIKPKDSITDEYLLYTTDANNTTNNTVSKTIIAPTDSDNPAKLDFCSMPTQARLPLSTSPTWF